MHARERIIRERFAAQACAQCGRQRAGTRVLVLARRRNTWLVLVTCAGCDHRGIYVVSFPTPASLDADGWRATDPLDVQVRPLSAGSLAMLPSAREPLNEPITVDDVSAMRAFLQTFDGDFHRAFAES